MLVCYGPEDPRDILRYGREGRFADRAFLTAGLIFVLIGAGMAITASSADGTGPAASGLRQAFAHPTMRSPIGPRMSMGK